MGPQATREYLARMRERYERAERDAKGGLLDEVCEVTGYHRKAVIRLLRRAAAPGPRRRRGRRVRTARRWWRRWCDLDGRRLSLVGPAEGAAARVAAVGAAPLATDAGDRAGSAADQRAPDRSALAGAQARAAHAHVWPDEAGTLLKHHIPVQTERWNVTPPGFTEIDLVSHSGDCADGEFLHSLNVTDIHTTWVETQAVMGKGQERVRQALEAIAGALPFALRGIDSDNGSEFINDHLYRYCRARDIQFTRGRPYKKDDNAHIEQKNWTHVRKLVGYVRYDSPAALAALNALYADLRLLQNLWLPSVKLVKKTRVGSRVRRYGPPQTPLERVRACPEADPAKVAALTPPRDPGPLYARGADRAATAATLRPRESSSRRAAYGRRGKPQERVSHSAHRPSGCSF